MPASNAPTRSQVSGATIANQGGSLDLDLYAAPGPLTELTTEQTEMIRQLALDPKGLCLAAQGLLAAPPKKN